MSKPDDNNISNFLLLNNSSLPPQEDASKDEIKQYIHDNYIDNKEMIWNESVKDNGIEEEIKESHLPKN